MGVTSVRSSQARPEREARKLKPASRNPPRRPPALRPGDRVDVVAPASGAESRRLRAGRRVLESLGYEVRLGTQGRPRRGHLAATDESRAKSLLTALRDPGTRAVFFARGGFGTARLLPRLAHVLERIPPKIVVGYSDATSLLLHASGRLGWVTFHGPMVASDVPELSAADRRSLVQTLAGEAPEPLPMTSSAGPGIAEGKLLGGCLSIVVALLGTPFAPDFRGALLFLEDVGEEPYRLDRMMTQLEQSGALAEVNGVVFGDMARCGRPREVRRVLEARTRPLGVPVGFGLPSGHGRRKRTLPLGVRARLDTRRLRLEILEPAVDV